MTHVVLAGATGRSLSPITWELPAGVVTLVDATGAAVELAELVAGVARPRRGSVRIDGVDPFRSPDTRRRVASVFDAEEPLGGRSVGQATAAVLRLRAISRSSRDVLGEHGLAEWLPRRPESLSLHERRRLALAIALSVEKPLAVVLAEPLSLGPPRGVLAEALGRRAREGAVVLCLTTSLRGALDLGGAVFGLRSGAPVPIREPGANLGGPGASGELRVHSGDPAALAGALSAEPAIGSVAAVGSGSRVQVVVRAANLAEASLAVMRIASERDITISSVSTRGSSPPTVLTPGVASFEARR